MTGIDKRTRRARLVMPRGSCPACGKDMALRFAGSYRGIDSLVWPRHGDPQCGMSFDVAEARYITSEGAGW